MADKADGSLATCVSLRVWKLGNESLWSIILQSSKFVADWGQDVSHCFSSWTNSARMCFDWALLPSFLLEYDNALDQVFVCRQVPRRVPISFMSSTVERKSPRTLTFFQPYPFSFDGYRHPSTDVLGDFLGDHPMCKFHWKVLLT